MKSVITMKKIFIGLASVLAATTVHGQRTTIGHEAVEVIKPYQPVLSEAIKITSLPQRDTLPVDPPSLEYSVEEKRYSTSYNITPIKPVRVKEEKIKELYRGYARAGYGIYNTLDAEAFYNALRSKDFDAGIHLKHLASGGSIKDYGFPGVATSHIKLHGTRFFTQSALDGHLSYQRDVSHFYGYTKPDIFSRRETQQTLHQLSARFGFGSFQHDADRLFYHASVAFSHLDLKTARYDGGENDFEMAFMAGKKLRNDHLLSAEFSLNPVSTVIPGNPCPPGQHCPQVSVVIPDIDLNRHIIRLRPRYEFEKSGLKLTAGANLSFEKSYGLRFWRFYPMAALSYPLIKNQVAVTGELSGDLKKNTLQTIMTQNPFVVPRQLVGEKFFYNTNNKLNVKGGVIVRPDQQLQLMATAGWERLLEDVLFANSLNTHGITHYSVVYDTVNRIHMHGAIQYFHRTRAGISLSTDYYSYTLPEEREALFRPSFRMKADAFYTIGEKIYLRAFLLFTGMRKALATDGYTRLSGYADLNIGMDYRYSPVLNFWIHVNNLTASHYMQWYRYPSYRFQALAGASISF
jgi:hypothetical protein